MHGDRRLALVQLTNLLAFSLPDDLRSRQIRRRLLNALGNEIHPEAVLYGGSYVFRWLEGRLKTGPGALLNRSCYYDLTGDVTLDAGVGVGHGSTFITAKHALGPPSSRAAGEVEPAPIHVKEGAWIAACCTILPGVTIGPGAVVAAGAVVKEDVAANTLVGGIPARPLRDLPADEQTARGEVEG